MVVHRAGFRLVTITLSLGLLALSSLPAHAALMQPVTSPSLTQNASMQASALAVGWDHTCALAGNGGVQCWGLNSHGQLGDGSMTERLAPTGVRGLTAGGKAISAGDSYTCALMMNGGVKCWGFNINGQLGDGTTVNQLVPVEVVGLSSGVSNIAAGWRHACALMDSGNVKCWGNNSHGQLGDGIPINQLVPADVVGLGGTVRAITTGERHTCALMVGGGVKCWGDNGDGQLGDSTTATQFTPVDVSGLGSGVSAIAAGGTHTCALMVGGGVKCWGNNGEGQLGDGTTTNHLTPVDVSGLAGGVSAIVAGGGYTCALMNTGGVKCWGYNSSGQLGDGTTADRLTPVDVSGLTSDVSAIVAGERHICALMINGGVKCWGSNSHNQLGSPTRTTRMRFSPADVSGLTDVVALSAGAAHTCALMSTGGVKCWGYNGSGQLGDGTTTTRFTPADVSGLVGGVAAIDAGGTHTCALIVGGGIKCWGDNGEGQLGDGTITNRLIPVDVSSLASGVSAIAAGATHTCAVMSTGGVKCWGSNSSGQLGDGTATNRLTPVDVYGLTSGVATIAVGETHTCIMMNTGSAKCWGLNNYGQLGDGTTTGRITPVDVSGLSSGVVAIAAGGRHTCAVMSTGNVKCWGDNTYGQLSVDDGASPWRIPQSVSGLAGIVTLSAGYGHTCALTVSGSIKCWGYNLVGELGRGDGSISRLPPGDVSGLTDVKTIAAGYAHTCALMSTGRVKCWGFNSDGELGINNGWAPVDVIWFSTYLPIVFANH